MTPVKRQLFPSTPMRSRKRVRLSTPMRRRSKKLLRRGKRSRWYSTAVRYVGDKPGPSSSSRTQAEAQESTNSRTLRSVPMINIDRQSAAATVADIDLRMRERDTIVVNGFKIWLEVKNNDSVPLSCNIAVLHPKDDGAGIDTAGFFRNHGADRQLTFNGTRSCLEFTSLPINSDHYVVLMHKRFRLGSATGFGSGNGDRAYRYLSMYLPLKRQVRYSGPNASDLVEGQVYLVWWCDNVTALTATSASPNAMHFAYKYVTFFENPK